MLGLDVKGEGLGEMKPGPSDSLMGEGAKDGCVGSFLSSLGGSLKKTRPNVEFLIWSR